MEEEKQDSRNLENKNKRKITDYLTDRDNRPQPIIWLDRLLDITFYIVVGVLLYSIYIKYARYPTLMEMCQQCNMAYNQVNDLGRLNLTMIR